MYKETNKAKPIRHKATTKNPIGIRSAIKRELIIESEKKWLITENITNGKIAVLEIDDSPSKYLAIEKSNGKTAPFVNENSIFDSNDQKITYGTGIFYFPAPYIQVQSYLASSLIYPPDFERTSKLDEYDHLQIHSNRPLCLLQNPISTSKDELVIAVFITEDEFNFSAKYPSFLLLDHPIPASRIQTIYVPRGDDELDIYLKGWLLADVPVPRHLFLSLDNEKARDTSDHPRTSIQLEKAHVNNYEIQMKRFDQMLGSLAYMRNTCKYYSQKMSSYQDIPKLYTNILKCILFKSHGYSKRRCGLEQSYPVR